MSTLCRLDQQTARQSDDRFAAFQASNILLVFESMVDLLVRNSSRLLSMALNFSLYGCLFLQYSRHTVADVRMGIDRRSMAIVLSRE